MEGSSAFLQPRNSAKKRMERRHADKMRRERRQKRTQNSVLAATHAARRCWDGRRDGGMRAGERAHEPALGCACGGEAACAWTCVGPMLDEAIKHACARSVSGESEPSRNASRASVASARDSRPALVCGLGDSNPLACAQSSGGDLGDTLHSHVTVNAASSSRRRRAAALPIWIAG